MAWLRRVLGREAAAADATPRPQLPDWKALGNAALGAGQLAEAARCYGEGVRAAPDDPTLRLNLGFALLEQGNAGAATECFEQALALRRPQDGFAHEAHFLLARARRVLGEAEAALAHYGAAVDARADFVPAMQEAIGLLQQLQRPEEALAWTQRWAQAEGSPAALLALSHALYLAGRPADALGPLEAILAADPGHAAALEGRGAIRLALGQPQEALADFDAALARGAAGDELLCGRGSALRRCGRPAEALQAIEQVLARNPRHRDALAERGGLLLELFRLPEAERALSEAIALHPDDHDLRWGRATARLIAGDMAGGWQDYEVRHRAPAAGLKFAPPDYGVPYWTGSEDLRGRHLLVIAEQGLGDSIQFARYLPLLQERGARITFNVPAVLHPLLQDALPGCALVHGGDVEKPDYACLLLSLPRAFGTTIDTVPARVPYLRSRPELRAQWEQRLGPRRGPRVGLVWAGGTLFGNDARRSIPLEVFRAIALPDVQFVSLQKEIRESDHAAFASWSGLSHHGDELRSFADTAALADLMDVVVSVDTSVAHLAGGLGRPLWVLLPHHPDWRWMVGRDDSPWYPTARLFRQSTPGDWPGVLERVRGELLALARAA